MNLEVLPKAVKHDIEDQSLEILERIADRIVVIGGWAVRAHLGEGHHRFTLDIDGVTGDDTFPELDDMLGGLGLDRVATEWGVKYHTPYKPRVVIPGVIQTAIDGIQLRIELSPPRIVERDTPHFFEFSLTDHTVSEIAFNDERGVVSVKVPHLADLTAVKLGLPVDYKNCFDAAMLLERSDIEGVITSIRSNDDWGAMVLRRLPKHLGRIRQKDSIEHRLALSAGLDIREHVRRLEYIADHLR